MYYNNNNNQNNGVDSNGGGGGNDYFNENSNEEQNEFDRTVEEIDEEMQRELAEDAPWKKIQQNTFTRWANEHLKLVNRRIDNLQYDLSDGLNLIALIEVLSHKKLPRHSKKPQFRSQKLENVSVALDFLENVEQIKLVNIDSTHLVDGKLKLILGLIWTLILHYSISMPMWEGEDQDANKRGSQPTPKQKLLSWIQSKLPPEFQIQNFTTDWNDGRAIGALVDSCAIGLYPDWQNNDPKNRLQNAKEAMDLAEQWLGIPQLIKPEEMIDPKVDELSMMTYLSQYPNAKLAPGAPLKPKVNISRIRCHGKGLEPNGNHVDAPAKFYVETFNAGKGDLEVVILNPKGQKETAQVEFQNDKNQTYNVTYTPSMEGAYKVVVKYAGQEVAKSPYSVYVEGKVGDSTKCAAHGPGIEPTGVTVDKPTYFEVDTENAGNGQVEIVILDAQEQHDQVPMQVKPIGKGRYRVEYLPKQPGLHSINVFFAGKAIPKSPFGVKVTPSCDAKKCRVYGRGVQPRGVRIGDVADFRVVCKDAGDGVFKAIVKGPDGYELPLRINKTNQNTYECGYNPTRVGPHQVHITYGGAHVQKSPYQVEVGPYKESLIRAFGPGLEGGVVGYSGDFIVETNGETGALGFSIEGPSQAKIDCIDNLDGSANVKYWPTAPGEYAIHILCDGEDIPGSPFMSWIEPKSNFDPNKVKAYGPGIDREVPLTINKPTEFTIDCTNGSGDAPIKVFCADSDYQKLDVTLKNNGNGTYTCRYTPIYPNRHTIIVTCGGVSIPESPYRVWAVEPSNPNKVRVYGPGVEKGVKTNQPTFFTVDCTGAGSGDVSISITNSKSQDINYDIDQKGDEILEVKYEAKIPGPHMVSITFNNEEIPQSPLKINVEPDVDISRIKVTGIDNSPQVGEPCSFNILTNGAVSSGTKIDANDVKVTIISTNDKTKQKLDAFIEATRDGFIPRFTLAEPGAYTVNIEVCDMPVKEFRIDAIEPVNPSKVKAYGPGLQQGTVSKSADFIIDTRGAGNGALNLTVEGPCEASIECKDNQDGTCHVSYLPTMAGNYIVNILFDNVHIPNSPFHVVVKSDLDIGKVRVYGAGVDSKGTFANSPTEFTVDAKAITNTGLGKVQCELITPNGKRHLCPVENKGDGTYTVHYVPNEIGTYQLDVTYENIPVPGTPFKTRAMDGCDPSRVKAYGPGLEGGITNASCEFTVETKGCGQGSLSLAVEGPAETKMICKENQNGTCLMEYLPVKAGHYDISIKYADKDVPGSPFRILIEDKVDPAQVKLQLPKQPFRVNVPSEIILDGHTAGKADACIDLIDTHGRVKHIQLQHQSEGIYVASVTPTSEGAHKLDCKWNGQSIKNSPFSINVLPNSEASKVKVDGQGVHNGIAASLPVSFTVDTRDAGFANLDINIKDPEGNLVQPKIEDNKDGTFNIYYVPEDVGRYTINVFYGSQHVKNSPFNVKVDPVGNAQKCQLSGTGLNPVIQVGGDYSIAVDTREAGQGNVTCHIKASNGNDLDIDVEDNGDGTFNIYYTPHNPGNYTIKIKFGGQDVPNGDLVVTAGDEHFIKQQQQQQLQQQSQQQQVTKSNYFPLQTKQQAQYSTQSNSQILHSTYSYLEESSVTQQQQQQQASSGFEQVNLRIPIQQGSAAYSSVKAKVKMPSGKLAQPAVEQNPDGTVSIKYQPSEIGLHELDVFYNSQPINGSPFKFHVDAINSSQLINENNNSYLGGYVTAYGPGLTHGLCGEACEFRIVTKDAGTGGLSVAVEGPSKAEIQCRDNKNGTCDVVFYPTAPGDYQISVKFADKHIFGSPFVAKIGGDSRKKNHVLMGGQSDISLKVIEGDVNDLYATIRSPSGLEEPCLLKKLPNGSLGISFTPREVGEHIVSVLREHKHIKNSPFKIEVRQSEIGDASKVKLYGQGLYEGTANKINEFIVNTKDAGYGGLSLSIEGPSKADIECHDNEDGSCRVTYKPSEPGSYLLNIKFADKHVPGSPFTVQVDGSGRLTERITRDRKAADTTHIGSICELSLKIPGTSPFDMSAHVQSPSAIIEDCEVIDLDDSNYCIRFVPKEMGIHTVSVKHKDMHIPGSPFEFTVGPIAGGGAHKVRAAGPGLLKGEVNQAVDFNIYTREAGAGALAIAIEGPSKAEINFHDRKDGTCGVSYVCCEPGEYQVSIKFNDEHIPDSPFTTYISPPIGDARKLTVHNLRTKQIDINKTQTFSVNLNGALGKIDAKLVSPSGTEEHIQVQDMGDGHYGMRFTPRENGNHYIHVRYNGIDIPESPFRVVVGQASADPGRVFATGTGLHSGETGKSCEFIIDTLNAGAGALAVTVDGPAKVQLDCKEVQEGYKVSFIPCAPGDYLITIKFVGVNIAGSPFKCKVNGPLLQHRLSTTSNALPIINATAREHSNIFFETVEKSMNTAQLQRIQTSIHSDASKVQVKGQGITKAFRNQKAQFTVDTRDAGNNMLMVGVYGPKAPCEEVVIKHVGNQQYQVTYCVKDKGEYMLIIKYGDQHIPGSPFRVDVV